MVGKLKKLAGYRLFLPLSCLITALLINLITTPAFFRIMINNGVLYGYIIDAINCASELVVLAVGMILVVSASAGTDISVGAVIAVAVAVCTGVLVDGEVSINKYTNPYVPVVLTALAAAMACGGSNGLLVVKLKIQPMMATLVLLTAGRGVSQPVINGWITYIRMGGYKLLGNDMSGIPIPIPILVAVIVVALAYILLKKAAMGMYIRSMGINERASRPAGPKSVEIIWMAHTFCGLCTGTAGLVTSPRIYSAGTNNIGLNMELDAITAVALDGNSLGDDRFSLPGSAIGAYTIQALTTALYAISTPAGQIPVYEAIAVIPIMAMQLEKPKEFRRRLASKHSSKNVEGGVA